MKCVFEINTRVFEKEPVELKHKKIIDLLKGVPMPWGLESEVEVLFPGFKGSFVASITLKKFLKSGLKMDLIYRYRNLLDDHHSSDDRVFIEFESNKVAYEYLIEEIFPLYLDIFLPYFSAIYNESLIYKDFELSRNKNYRKKIVRFYPVVYYDAKFCYEVLKMSVKNVFEKLNGEVFKILLRNEGIIIIAAETPLSVDESDLIDKKIRTLLSYKG